MKVSVIIVNFNGEKFIGECVRSVARSLRHVKSLKAEIIIVDNASTDGSLKKISNEKIKIIKSQKQLYFTGGCNLGAKKAKGEKLFFLNSDTVVDENCIGGLIRFLDGHKKWLVQPKILRLNSKYQLPSTKQVSGTKKLIENAGNTYDIFGMGRGRGYMETDFGQYDKIYETDYTVGTAFMIDRRFFWELGGFDPWYKYQYEDVDLNLRAKRAGGKSFYYFKSVVYHEGGATFKNNISKRELLFYIRRNRLMTAWKNFRGMEKIFRAGVVVAENISFRSLGTIGAVISRLMEIKIDEQNLTIKVNELLKYLKAGRFLDVGAGDGKLLKALPYEGFGVEPKDNGVSFEKYKTNLQFDGIGFYESLEHMKDPLFCLKKAGRLLKQKGILVIEVPLFDNLVAKFLGKKYFGFNDYTHKHFFTQNKIYELLDSAGFRPVSLGFTFFKYPFSGVGLSNKTFPVVALKILDFLSGKREFIRIYARKI